MNKLKMWNEAEWDAGAKEAAQLRPLKGLKRLPNMPGITPDTAKNLTWKALKYMVAHDEGYEVLKRVMKHPLKYGVRYTKSLLGKQSHTKDDDFFLYNIEDVAEFQKLLVQKDTLLVVGFSYCHKPFECPSGRFTDKCIADAENRVCRQCFIGKMVNALPETGVIPLFITTIHYIGANILEIVQKHPDQQVIFLITACEMTLEMFADWGNMAGIRGIGVRLDGRICNTMRAFELSEKGVKPGLTVVLDKTQQRMLDLIQIRRELEACP